MCTCTCDGVRCCLSLIGLALCPSFSQEHGHFTISSQQLGRLTEGTTVTIRCNRGYSPIDDNNVVTCSPEGVWSPNIPKCAGIVLNGCASTETTHGVVYMIVRA